MVTENCLHIRRSPQEMLFFPPPMFLRNYDARVFVRILFSDLVNLLIGYRILYIKFADCDLSGHVPVHCPAVET